MPEADTDVIYKDVVDYPGYKVGSDGSVWSCWEKIRRTVGQGYSFVLGRIWKRMKHNHPKKIKYPGVNLRKNGKTRFERIHTLVLNAFVGPRLKGHCARHFPDRTESNVSLENLSWGTYEQNQTDRIAHKTGRNQYGKWSVRRKKRAYHYKTRATQREDKKVD